MEALTALRRNNWTDNGQTEKNTQIDFSKLIKEHETLAKINQHLGAPSENIYVVSPEISLDLKAVRARDMMISVVKYKINIRKYNSNLTTLNFMKLNSTFSIPFEKKAHRYNVYTKTNIPVIINWAVKSILYDMKQV